MNNGHPFITSKCHHCKSDMSLMAEVLIKILRNLNVRYWHIAAADNQSVAVLINLRIICSACLTYPPPNKFA